jgi:hypothetical protein
MILTELQGIANAVLRRAQRQGYVAPQDIRAELARAGLPEDRWRDVVELTREVLHFRDGRYHFLSSVSPRRRQEQSHQQQIAEAIHRLIRHYRTRASQSDRRQEDRIDFVQPVQVTTEDGRRSTVLSRDVSPTGIRLVGTRSLLGQKLHVALPTGEDGGTTVFLVRVLWTAAIGEDLFENGGAFIEVVVPAAQALKLVRQ